MNPADKKFPQIVDEKNFFNYDKETEIKQNQSSVSTTKLIILDGFKNQGF